MSKRNFEIKCDSGGQILSPFVVRLLTILEDNSDNENDIKIKDEHKNKANLKTEDERKIKKGLKREYGLKNKNNFRNEYLS